MSEILRNLNQQQYEAVTSLDKYLRVIAGAGSGKTRVLTCRIAFLIKEMGIEPSSILAITFTNKAANEMKRRVEGMVGVEAYNATVTTFHSFCARFLRAEIHHIGYPNSFVIADEEDQLKIVKDIAKEMNLPSDFKPKNLISYISFNKCCGYTPSDALRNAEDFDGEKLKAKVYAKYEEFLNKNFYLDFDDLIIKAVEILKNFPFVKQRWNDRFAYILVDEFQDTNDLQYELITLLLSEQCSLFVVGDPDQTIYTWRGANVDLIMDFKKRFKGSRDIFLNKNYRSTKNILKCANALIKNNIKRVEKDLVTDNEEGGKVIRYEATSSETEADFVVQRIRELKSKNLSLKYSDFAILYRSNYYSRSFEQALINYRVPYVIYGGVKFFDRKEIKDSIAYLRLALKEDDTLAFERIINVPRRGIGDKTIQDLKDKAAENNCSLFEICKQVLSKKNARVSGFVKSIEEARKKMENTNQYNFADILKSLMESSGYMEALREEKEAERIENIEELASYLFSLQTNDPNMDIATALQEITLYSAQDEMVSKDSVTLMTVHTAKGLEYPYVFVVGLSDGVFPSARSIRNEGFFEDKDAIEEERRLAYVGFTRAMKQLFITNSTGFNYASGGYLKASRFIIELENNYVHYQMLNARPKTFTKPSYTPKKEFTNKAVLKDSNVDYRPGDLIEHTAYGQGIVLSVQATSLTIVFKNPAVGQKIISKKFTGIKKV